MKDFLSRNQLYFIMIICSFIIIAISLSLHTISSESQKDNYYCVSQSRKLILQSTKKNSPSPQDHKDHEYQKTAKPVPEKLKGQPAEKATSLESAHEKISNKIITGLQSPYPEERIAAIETATECEDEATKKTLEEYIFKLIDPDDSISRENDNDVIEAAIAFCSLTNSGNSVAIIQSALERNTLSSDLLAYIGEVLFEDKKVNKETVLELVHNSPSYSKLDSSEKENLSTILSEIFTGKNNEQDIQTP